jgi:hypothetical protein
MAVLDRGTRIPRLGVFVALLAATAIPSIALASYPPQIPPPDPNRLKIVREVNRTQATLFSNTHAYGLVTIQVDVYDNYLGDFTKYHWVYTVTNHTYDPNPGVSNGFSGFELALPMAVPDIADIAAPDGIGPWLINCCSGLPVEWDLTNTGGGLVGGGTMPGETEVYSFTTAPRLVTASTGWFHTWQTDVQTDIINYPLGNEPEVPDVLSAPGQELCCIENPPGVFSCVVLPAGQCRAVGGIVVVSCNQCPPVTKIDRSTWSKLKKFYR